MTFRYFYLGLIFILSLLFAFPSSSLAIYKKAGTSGASFLKIGVSAKASAMADSFTAIDGDINALHYNPAGLAQIKNKQISFMYNMWFQDIKHGYIAFVTPLSSQVAMGGSFIYLKIDDIRRTTSDFPSGHPSLGTFGANDIALALSPAFSINKYLSLGANFKIIKEKIYTHKSNNVFAVDLGTMIKFPFKDLNLGMSILNMGQKVKFEKEEDPLPLNFKLGVSSKLLRKNLLLAFEVNKPVDHNLNFHYGLEYTVARTLALRLGYMSGPSKVENDLTYGVGLKFLNMTFDYAFTLFDNLGKTHKISFTTSF